MIEIAWNTFLKELLFNYTTMHVSSLSIHENILEFNFEVNLKFDLLGTLFIEGRGVGLAHEIETDSI